ncbi:hypothetical protein HMPREF0766_10372 [Sphingobacterium spiritivorum ATCC 33861]|uniref:Uncharacterized protein n=1 Tax=Sphingobacterium spiritivorum ATCC 33861 TaxID=525373 RepID=D7VHA3_SPHSI|nr:hypothetical protein HMPREF0766_10372 [Sphingobacterium spiritivorum ATCC 33861]
MKFIEKQLVSERLLFLKKDFVQIIYIHMFVTTKGEWKERKRIG